MAEDRFVWITAELGPVPAEMLHRNGKRVGTVWADGDWTDAAVTSVRAPASMRDANLDGAKKALMAFIGAQP